jgi:hypothetical protein
MPAPFIASYGDLGYAKEVVFGTPVAAAFYVPFKSLAIDKDPGLFDIKLARQQRELTTYVMPGEQKIPGKTEFSLFSIMGMHLVVGALGVDQYQAGSTPTNATTLAAPSVAGATTLSTTLTFSVNDIVMVDTTVSLKSELRKVTIVSGAGPYTITLDAPLVNAHASGAVIAKNLAPFTHNIVQQNTVQSFTLEQNLGGLQSIQYAGCVPGKISLKAATKEEVIATIDWVCQKDATFSPTVPTYSADQPFVLAGTTLSLMGSGDTAVESFGLDVDNVLEEHYTYSGQRYPTFIVAKGRTVAMKVTETLQNMTMYASLAAANSSSAPTAGVNTITCVSGTDQIVFTLPQVSLAKLSKPMKAGDVIMADIDFKAWLGTLANSLTAVITSAAYLQY